SRCTPCTPRPRAPRRAEPRASASVGGAPYPPLPAGGAASSSGAHGRAEIGRAAFRASLRCALRDTNVGRWDGGRAMHGRFEQGEVLFRGGDPSDFAIMIHSGSAEVLRRAGGDSIVLGTVHAGEFVGEMGVLEGRARSATV